jgi:hypothetical protein
MSPPVAVENYPPEELDTSLPLSDQRHPPVFGHWSAELLVGTDFGNANIEDAPSFLAHPNVPPPEASADMVVQRRWRGTVDTVDGEVLHVRLVGEDGIAEDTIVQPFQVSPSELSRAVEGASFEWRVGYRDEPGGRRVGLSVIEFDPPYVVSRHEREQAAAEGERIAARLAQLRESARAE